MNKESSIARTLCLTVCVGKPMMAEMLYSRCVKLILHGGLRATHFDLKRSGRLKLPIL